MALVDGTAVVVDEGVRPTGAVGVGGAGVSVAEAGADPGAPGVPCGSEELVGASVDGVSVVVGVVVMGVVVVDGVLVGALDVRVGCGEVTAGTR